MQISHLVLRNFRRYEHARFNFHANFTVIIGNNGGGKTTVLDALALMLNTYFQGSSINTGGSTIKKDDARLLIYEKGEESFREPQTEVYLTASAQIETHLGTRKIDWRRELGDRGGNAKEFVQLGVLAREQIGPTTNPDLPLLLYYGAGRLWDTHRKVETEKPGSQLDAYRYCLDPKSDHEAFEKWFKKRALSALQRQQHSPATHAVKAAVLCCIPGALDFYHDVEEDQIMIKLEKEGLLPFNYLSDGYRNMVAMVADIAHRAARLNPQYGADAATQTSGIVLIDEIDLHLHPKWQRRVVQDLQKAFPKLQFIATTHSPFIIQSMKAGEMIDLEQTISLEALAELPTGIAAPGPAHAFASRSVEDIVEQVMGVAVPQRSQRAQEMYAAAQEYFRVLERIPAASAAEKEDLKRRLDTLSAPFSDNIAYHAFLEMERLAAGLGSSSARSQA